MSTSPLDNLVRIGQLKVEPPAKAEFDGLLPTASATWPSTRASWLWTRRWWRR